ncbi:MAG: methylmalonyl Co-A mutase-associated GTPase MeaB, partial [Nitrososphaerales archaeon]
VTGGAILGDRVRMISHTLDEGVYIRSMASRGDEGGLSRAAMNAVRILDAAGNDIVFLETVGIGQAEVEVVRAADAVVVVLMPELGDEVQAAKAGLMEIGDIFVVNKSDLPGSDRVMYNLHPVLASKSGWRQLALKVSAKTGEGIEEIVSKIDEFRSFEEKSDSLRERKLRNVSEELIQNVSAALFEHARARLERSKDLEKVTERVVARKIDPESATRLLLEGLMMTSEPRDILNKRKKRP